MDAQRRLMLKVPRDVSKLCAAISKRTGALCNKYKAKGDSEFCMDHSTIPEIVEKRREDRALGARRRGIYRERVKLLGFDISKNRELDELLVLLSAEVLAGKVSSKQVREVAKLLREFRLLKMTNAKLKEHDKDRRWKKINILERMRQLSAKRKLVPDPLPEKDFDDGNERTSERSE